MELIEDTREPLYDLTLTNNEVKRMFYSMVKGWFAPAEEDYNDFVKAMLQNDIEAMNVYIMRFQWKYSVIFIHPQNRPAMHRRDFTTDLS